MRAIPYTTPEERDAAIAALSPPSRVIADHRNLDGTDELHVTDEPGAEDVAAAIAAATTIKQLKNALLNLPALTGRSD